jgi:hypothetical protein
MKKAFVLFLMIVVLNLSLVSCGVGQFLGPTTTPTFTNTPTYTQTFTPTATITLTNTPSNTPTNTPVPLPGKIHGVIFIPQIGMPWVTDVNLYKATTEIGELVGHVKNDRKGNYLFEDVKPGKYRIVVYWIKDHIILFPYRNPECGFSEDSTTWSPHMDIDKSKGFDVVNEYFASPEINIINGDDIVEDMTIKCSDAN